ncbi:MAG: hypothetical protein PSV23_00540 [Brevundimonas sp.]|uniref:hypothetical protein n=1 Tax=Brevundimonas sp. TaxID=1871086 RepID=UPI002488BDBE|nr:hypothetical protein [Brevundimonas sp.]MDI1325274.1 hypothetical protein [Brevundimonas sp.]
MTAVVLAVAGPGCQSMGGAAIQPVSLAGGVVTITPPGGFETTVQPPRPGATSQTVTFRGPAWRRGNFNNCTVRSVRIEPADLNDESLGEFVASAARKRHAVHQSTDGLHDVSLGEPVPGRANDPYVVRSSFTIDYTLRTSERYWGVRSAAGDFVIIQNCGTGGSPEELAAIEDATRPLFPAP